MYVDDLIIFGLVVFRSNEHRVQQLHSISMCGIKRNDPFVVVVGVAAV